LEYPARAGAMDKSKGETAYFRRRLAVLGNFNGQLTM